MKIDVFAHILPRKYLTALKNKMGSGFEFREARNIATVDIDMRLRLMDRYPDVIQILTVSLPPLETLVSPKDAIELSRIANDELAELVARYPDKFIAAAACLPLNELDAALEETDRAITQLGLKGIQVFSNIDGESLGMPKFKSLYEKMANYDLPIWIHPWVDRKQQPETVFVLDEQTGKAMWQLVEAGTFLNYPDLKFITHHSGGIIPLFDGRIKWMRPFIHKDEGTINTLEHLRKFYVDTACSGSTAALMCGYNFFGPDKMLFGTDAPLGPPFGLTLETIHSVERMSIPDVEKHKIFEENAVKLFRMAI